MLAAHVWGKVSGRALNSGEKTNISVSLAIHLLKHLIELGLGLGLGLGFQKNVITISITQTHVFIVKYKKQT